jgi:hypothetical protein
LVGLSLSGRNKLWVFENRVLRRIFGPRRYEEGPGRLHNDELHSLHSSLNIVTVISSRKMRWVGHGACTEGRGEVFTGFWLGGPKT